MKTLRNILNRLGCTLACAALALSQAAPVTAYANNSVDKSETVHVQTDATGAVTSITVEEVLANTSGAATLEDSSTLTDIKADDENQSFVAGKGHLLTWTTGGKQVRYEGKSTSTLPVRMKVTYKLDGATVQPAKLGGATGHLVIRIDYEADPVASRSNGSLRTPFVCMTVATLDSEVFNNVQVENGRVIEDKGGLAVVGFALPGLEESLGLRDTGLDVDLDLPEYLVISADVHDFELDPIFTMVTPELFTDLDTSSLNLDLGDLDRGADELSDAMAALIEGSGGLTSALDEITEGSSTLGGGAKALREALSVLPDSLDALSTGAHSLSDGLDGASGSAALLADGAAQVSEAAQGSQSTISAAQGAVQGAQGTVADLLETLGGFAGTPGALESARTAAGEAHDAATRASQGLSEAAQALGEATAPASATMADASAGLTAASESLDQTAASLAEASAALGSFPTEGLTEEQLQALALAQQTLAAADSSLTNSREGLLGASSCIDEAQTELAGVSASVPPSVQEDIDALDAAAQTIAQNQEDIADPQTLLDSASTASGSLDQAQSSLGAASELAAGVVDGADQLNQGATALKEALDLAASGAGELASGIDQMNAASPQLVEGAGQLDNGVARLTEALRAATEGSQSLTSGLSTFNAEGVSRLGQELRGIGTDVDDMRARMDDLRAAARAYDSFAGKAEGQTSQVRFIFKTESIG